MPATATDRAALLLDLRRYADAAAAAREVIAAEPDDFTGYLQLARALGGQGKLVEAQAAAQAGLRKGAGQAWAASVMGWVLAEAGRAAVAVPHYREAVRLDPTYTHAWSGLAHVLWQLNDFAGSLDAANAGLHHDPTDETLLAKRGHAERQLGRPADALATAARGRDLYPNSPRFWHLRGCVTWTAAVGTLALGGRWARAYPDLREAARLDPATPAYRDDLRRFVGEWRQRAVRELAAALGMLLLLAAAGYGVVAQHPAGAAVAVLGWALPTAALLAQFAEDPVFGLAAPLERLGLPTVPLDDVERRTGRMWWRVWLAASAALAVGAVCLVAWAGRVPAVG